MSREAEWKRISELAGLDEDGGILPPSPEITGINRQSNPCWKTYSGYDVLTLAEDEKKA